MHNIASVLSNEIGERVGGTEGEKKAANFIAQKMNVLGLKTVIKEYEILGWKQLSNSLSIISPNMKDINCISMGYTCSTDLSGVEGLIRKVGKMHIIPGRMEWPKYELVSDGYAKAYIVSNPQGQAIPIPNTRPLLCKPVVIIGRDDSSWLDEMLSNNIQVRARLTSITQYLPGQLSYNVIGMTNQKLRSCIVVSAHMDSVPFGVGAVDNASGVEAMLKIAEKLSSYNQTKELPFGIEYIAFGSEEHYLVGSTHYIFDAMDRSLIEQIKFCINIDMVGAGSKIIFRIGTEEMLIQIKKWMHEENISEMDISIDTPKASTDYWSFYQCGIPGVDILTQPYEYYHQPFDTYDKIEQSKIEKVVDLVYSFIKWTSENTEIEY